MTPAEYVYLPMSPSETRVSLLHGHNIQLQDRGPHQPLLTVEMRPRQGFVRQAPQALHEGSVAIIQTWDSQQWEAPMQEHDDGRSIRALTIQSTTISQYIVDSRYHIYERATQYL